jgi:predicted nucleotidyltransferase
VDRETAGGTMEAARLRERALALLRAMPRLEATVAVGLVGSVARGTAGERSDIDVFVVLPDGDIPLAEEMRWWDAVREVLRPLRREVSVLLYTPGGIRAVANWYVLRLASDAVFAHDPGGSTAALLGRVAAQARAAGFEERECAGRPYWIYTGDVTRDWKLELGE